MYRRRLEASEHGAKSSNITHIHKVNKVTTRTKFNKNVLIQSNEDAMTIRHKSAQTNKVLPYQDHTKFFELPDEIMKFLKDNITEISRCAISLFKSTLATNKVL